MSNSAFTPTFAQNLQDASATQKGLVNTTTQTFAGKKTFDGGAVIKGDTSGNAVAAGYVGQLLQQTWTGETIATTATTLATHSTVTTGVYLAFVETDCLFGSSTRVTSTIGGTAVISITKTAAGGDFIRCLDSAAAALYATYYIRVATAGSITFAATSFTNNASNCRGSFNLVRIA